VQDAEQNLMKVPRAGNECCPSGPQQLTSELGGKFMENEALSIVDQRTKATYNLPLSKGAVRAMDLRQIKTGPEDFGAMS
jgi:hypothetical protein